MMNLSSHIGTGKEQGGKDNKLAFPDYMQICTFHLLMLFYTFHLVMYISLSNVILHNKKVIPEKSEIKLKQINLTVYQVGGIAT